MEFSGSGSESAISHINTKNATAAALGKYTIKTLYISGKYSHYSL